MITIKIKHRTTNVQCRRSPASPEPKDYLTSTQYYTPALHHYMRPIYETNLCLSPFWISSLPIDLSHHTSLLQQTSNSTDEHVSALYLPTYLIPRDLYLSAKSFHNLNHFLGIRVSPVQYPYIATHTWGKRRHMRCVTSDEMCFLLPLIVLFR
jgi:hypothetical protein